MITSDKYLINTSLLIVCVCTCRVSYSERGKGEYPPRFQVKCISTYIWPEINMQQHLNYKPSGAPEATSESPKFKNFLGEHISRLPTPQEQCASHDQFFPLPNNKILYETCVYVYAIVYVHCTNYCLHTHTHTYMYMYTHTHPYIPKKTHTHIHVHTYIPKTHTDTQTCTQNHTFLDFTQRTTNNVHIRTRF